MKALKTLATSRGGSMLINYDISRGVYTTNTALASRCVESVSWNRRCAPATQNIRRDLDTHMFFRLIDFGGDIDP